MVVTVEPGLYIAPDETGIDAKWKGIGIRIEDDVVVSAKGPDVLSHGVPKEPDAIEEILANR
jgi:Xaa-Pro aminopeptidase